MTAAIISHETCTNCELCEKKLKKKKVFCEGGMDRIWYCVECFERYPMFYFSKHTNPTIVYFS